ncbi:hypothetical protein [Flammeovirga sp. EKP202]|uniref:hypothetical protein n=1 Tax=Flammeovirga sp. EKP202 TaxID=2770592 RepID=UPI00165F83A8|nr:hypothetical protein [Flammeovirga sp. EKP202]MBD0403649.1 hypothetical protein [Flammeovirga sp. EKP202]
MKYLDKVELNWDRLWCKQGYIFALDESGFLFDPDTKKSFYRKTNVVKYSEINKLHCLILLGEPGIGKSTTLRKEYLKHKEKQKEKAIFIYKDLGEYGDENRLIDEVFKSREIEEWFKSDKPLYYYLDSFDECLLEIKRLFQILKRQFDNFKDISSRLFIRITCRTGFWSDYLTLYLKKLFGGENVEAYELTPLKKLDVKLATNQIGLNSENFINELIDKELQPLAINPLTLDFLIQEYIKTNSFPSSKQELFYYGCKTLCSEPNFERQMIYKTSNLSPEKRIALASRIAAVMIFCNKGVIDLGKIKTYSNDRITVDLLLEGEENTDDFSFEYIQQDLIDTITNTSLFTSRGNLLFGFTHLAFAEYLASKFIANNHLEIEQIKSLISLSTDDEDKVIPQMKGVASWLSIIDTKVAEETIKNDPQNILHGDLDVLSISYKEKIVDSLLKKFSENTIVDGDWGLHKQYKKLNHPNLYQQLKPYIEDKERNFLPRRVAIDIAEACKLYELNSCLLKVVFDETEDIHIRSHVVHALIEIGDSETKKQLIPLATQPQELDKDDDLKGYALQALWPDILTTNDVFEFLTSPKRSNYSGGYVFFMYLLHDSITKSDLDSGLKWILNNISFKENIHYKFGNLEDVIINQCWNFYQNIKDKNLFAQVLLLRMKKYQTIFPTPQKIHKTWNSLSVGNEVRYSIFKELIKIVGIEQIHFVTHNEIIKKNDFEELINIIKQIENSELIVKIAKVLSYFHYSDSKSIDIILTLCQKYKEFQSVFSHWLRTIEIDSEEADKLKKDLEQRKKWEEEEKERDKAKETRKIDVALRITNDIEQFESDRNISSWYQLFMDLTLSESSTHYGDELNSNVLNLPGWEYVDSNLKIRIIESAKFYVNNFNDNKSEWFGTNTFHRPATAGYKSLVLLFHLQNSFIEKSCSTIWENWKHILIDYPESYGIGGKDETYLSLITLAYSKIPKGIVDIILEKIDIANRDDDNHLTFLHKIDSCLDDAFQNALLEKVKDSTLKPLIKNILLTKLLEKENKDASNYNIELFNKSKGEEKVLYAKSLASFCNSQIWDIIMSEIRSNPDFGKDFFLSFVNTYDVNMIPLLERLSELQSSELFLWLIDTFPREEDPVFEGAHMVGKRESVANFRDQILRDLTGKGTRESIQALDKIKSERKDLNIDFYLVEAKTNFRINNWEPLSPKELLLLAKSSKVRVILNPADLQNLVLDSLKRLEFILQGSNSLSGVLWDKIDSKKFKPKSEEHLSDYIKHHLDNELRANGISTYREVQLRKPNYIPGGKQGEVTDIFVSFTDPKSKEAIEVIIEIKGSWNEGVNTSMETQLKDRYLETSNCKHGIYLVGWFNCDALVSHSNKTEKSTLIEAKTFYNEEADKLSNDNKLIKSFVLDCSLRN